MANQDRADLVRQYNLVLREHISNRKRNDDRIILADMEAALNSSEHLAGDGIYLNEAGYKIMGTVYYEAINEIVGEE